MLKVFKSFYPRWYFPPLFFLLLTALAWWPLTFLLSSLPFDMSDCWLPWRFFIGESLLEGQFPFWNPYQQLGYPIHADLQGPSLYPEAWLVGVFFGHNVITLQYLFIAYLAIGGWGMFTLARQLNIRRDAALITGAAYLLSGFFVGHAQHFFSVISVAWFPFLIAFYLSFLRKGQVRDVLIAAIFLFLMITGGNQTYTILAAYLLMGLSVFYAWPMLLKKDWPALLRFSGLHALFATATLAMSAGTMVVWRQISPFVERLGGMEYAEAQVNPFTPSSLLSLLFPFSTTVDPSEIFLNDVAMRNLYLGLIPLVIFTWCFTQKRSRLDWLFLGFGAVGLLASMGEYTPVHRWMYDFLPMIDRFRFPSYFHWFTLLAVLILFGRGLTQYLESPESNKKWLFRIAAGWLLVLGVITCLSWFKIEEKILFLEQWDEKGWEALRWGEFWGNVFFQGVIQVLVLAVFIVLLKYTSGRRFVLLTAGLLILDMGIATQLNAPKTGLNLKSAITLQKAIDVRPDGFPIPAMEKHSYRYDKDHRVASYWRNSHVYRKEISPDGFNSFWFDDHLALFKGHPELGKAVMNNTPVFLTDVVKPLSEVDQASANAQSADCYVEEEVYEQWRSLNSQGHQEDDHVKIVEYRPSRWLVKVNTSHPQVLSFLQTHYPGWKATVNGEAVETFTSNLLMASLMVPAGESLVEFRYENSLVVWAFIFGMTVFLSILIYLAWTGVRLKDPEKKRRKQVISTTSIGLVTVLVVLTFLMRIPAGEKERNTIAEAIGMIEKGDNSELDSILVLAQVNDLNFWEQEWSQNFGGADWKALSFFSDDAIKELARTLPEQTDEKLIWVCINNYTPPLAKNIISYYYPVDESENPTYLGGTYKERLKGEPGSKYTRTDFNLDFEYERQYWNYNPKAGRTEAAYSGEKGMELNEKVEYSPTFNARFKDMDFEDGDRIDISLRVKTEELDKGSLIFSSARNKKQTQFEKSALQDWVDEPDEWSVIFLTVEPKEWRPHDQIHIYFRNTGKKLIHIDDFRVEVVPED